MMSFNSSTSGKQRYRAALALTLAFGITSAILANSHAQTAGDPGLLEAIRAFEETLRQKDIERVLGAWQFESPGARSDEEIALRDAFWADAVTLTSDVTAMSVDRKTASTLGTLTQISEPRGAIEQWSLVWKRTELGWRITSKETFGGMDGLVHLDLQNTGFVANGQTIELEDFTLVMNEGTIFLNTEEAGPTALVFVGKGRVVFKPRPPTERGQMKIYAKSEVLDDDVSQAFLRLHPADLYRTLKPGSFVDDPKSEKRRGKAVEYFERHKNGAFVLDAPVAGAPWWLLPNLGDAAIVFDTRRFGELTLTLNTFAVEGVSLFNRGTQRQISAYPRADAPATAEEPEIDVIHHDLSLWLDPETFDLTGRAAIAVEIKGPMTTLRFHLDDDLAVRSVRSTEGGRHLFFRVRGQNTVLVSLGSMAGRVGRLNLVVDYAGRLPAGTVESEIIRAGQDLAPGEPPPFIDPALIYSKRRPFYPDPGEDDYATSTLKVTLPADWTVVSGGVKTERRDGPNRTITYEQTQGAKYIAFVASRMLTVGSEPSGPLVFDAYVQPRARGDASRSVAALKSASQFLTTLFGPLPYSPVNLAIVEAVVPGGHSPPGLVILQQRPPLMGTTLRDDPANFYDIPGFFLAHELAHQWWGHGVRPRSYRDRWISEGFAQYAAALWTRESEGVEAFNGVLRKMANWAKRMSAFGPVDLGNRVGHIQNNAQAHRAVVYNKAALVLDMVHRVIGADAFRRASIRLQSEHRFGPVDTETVRAAFEAEGAVDLKSLWDVFVRNTALPTMHLETSAAGPEIVVVGYSGPLPVTARIGDQRLDLVIRSRLAIPGVGAGAKIELDPDEISLVSVER